MVSKKLPSLDALDELPFTNYDYSKVQYLYTPLFENHCH